MSDDEDVVSLGLPADDDYYEEEEAPTSAPAVSSVHAH
jgi:hypothetical protein